MQCIYTKKIYHASGRIPKFLRTLFRTLRNLQIQEESWDEFPRITTMYTVVSLERRIFITLSSIHLEEHIGASQNPHGLSDEELHQIKVVQMDLFSDELKRPDDDYRTPRDEASIGQLKLQNRAWKGKSGQCCTCYKLLKMEFNFPLFKGKMRDYLTDVMGDNILILNHQALAWYDEQSAFTYDQILTYQNKLMKRPDGHLSLPDMIPKSGSEPSQKARKVRRSKPNSSFSDHQPSSTSEDSVTGTPGSRDRKPVPADMPQSSPPPSRPQWATKQVRASASDAPSKNGKSSPHPVHMLDADLSSSSDSSDNQSHRASRHRSSPHQKKKLSSSSRKPSKAKVRLFKELPDRQFEKGSPGRRRMNADYAAQREIGDEQRDDVRLSTSLSARYAAGRKTRRSERRHILPDRGCLTSLIDDEEYDLKPFSYNKGKQSRECCLYWLWTKLWSELFGYLNSWWRARQLSVVKFAYR